MPSKLQISVTFLDRAFHGRRDAGEPEWPPSPLRLFQALVASAAARWNGEQFEVEAAPALRWLEQQAPPDIVAPQREIGGSYRLSVPNNAMDIVGRAWARGNLEGDGDADPRTHRAMKTVRPTRLIDGDTVHYLWELPESASNDVLGFVESLCIASRNLVALGWGIDLVAGGGRVISNELSEAIPGERWQARGTVDGNGLRTPMSGTLEGLSRRHQAFLRRLPEEGGFSPVPSLSVFRTTSYRCDMDPQPRGLAAFQILKPDASGFRAFNTLRQTRIVAGMVRHAVALAAEPAGWAKEKIGSFVLGHGEARRETHVPVAVRRFAYLPLPSIEGRGEGKRRVVGSIRRVLITSFDDGCEPEIAWARRAISGTELIDDKSREPTALLSLLPESDPMVGRYRQPAASWSTVTPVVLPGFDDRTSRKTEALIRKAIVQAGFHESLARNAELEWRKVGFFPGTELARHYSVPDYLRNYSTYHIRLTWRDSTGTEIRVPGPICLGGGRFCGLGLFAAQRE